MKQENKELLFKNLSARLPYRVKFNYGGYNGFDYTLEIMSSTSINDDFPIGDCKPYLRSMSSMTEEERKEYELLANRCISTSVGFVHFDAQELIDWLLKNHFDYCGLIGKSLAIEVTKDNNPYK